MGKSADVAPYSGAMLETVARSGRESDRIPSPKNSTKAPTTPTRRSTWVRVRTRSVAVLPSGIWPRSRTPTISGTRSERGWPRSTASASMPPTPHPRTPSAFTMGVCESVPTRVSGKATTSPSTALRQTTGARASRFTWCTIPVPGGTMRRLSKACWAQRKSAYRSWFLSYSFSTFRRRAVAVPKKSTCTEWSITKSAGTTGFTRRASPPRRATAARMAARSTRTGTPVRSCRRTRAGKKGNSRPAPGLPRGQEERVLRRRPPRAHGPEHVFQEDLHGHRNAVEPHRAVVADGGQAVVGDVAVRQREDRAGPKGIVGSGHGTSLLGDTIHTHLLLRPSGRDPIRPAPSGDAPPPLEHERACRRGRDPAVGQHVGQREGRSRQRGGPELSQHRRAPPDPREEDEDPRVAEPQDKPAERRVVGGRLSGDGQDVGDGGPVVPHEEGRDLVELPDDGLRHPSEEEDRHHSLAEASGLRRGDPADRPQEARCREEERVGHDRVPVGDVEVGGAAAPVPEDVEDLPREQEQGQRRPKRRKARGPPDASQRARQGSPEGDPGRTEDRPAAARALDPGAVNERDQAVEDPHHRQPEPAPQAQGEVDHEPPVPEEEPRPQPPPEVRREDGPPHEHEGEARECEGKVGSEDPRPPGRRCGREDHEDDEDPRAQVHRHRPSDNHGEPPPGEPGHEGGDPAREHAVLPGEEVLAPDPGSDQGGGHLGSGPHDRHRPPPQRRHVGRGEEGKRLVGALGEEGSGPEEKEREDGKAHSHGGPREPAPVGEGEGAAQRPPLCFGR